MKRDYNAEIIRVLKQRPRNGVQLQQDLGIASNKMYGILKSMEEAKLIRWVDTTSNDGEWRIA